MRGFLIAGSASGVGKTTVALAVIAAMRRRGLEVQAFKGGPDFLDTGHLTRVSGRAARNVDTWMVDGATNLRLVGAAARGADALVVEGMMGLFDGKDAETDRGSSAEIAKLLRMPVVLVLDAGKSARSIAAVVLGFESFDPELRLAGVVLNRVASERHYAMLATAIQASCATPVLGWLPREPAVAIPERHLGLQTVEESPSRAGDGENGREELLAGLAERTIQMERLLELECGMEAAVLPRVSPVLRGHGRSSESEDEAPVRIGVARDRAFSFYYEDNFDLLAEAGAELVRFSPLADESLPERLDGLYLGGGYPELYLEELSGNATMREAVRAFAASGGPIYAECGGMLYLGRELTALDGRRYPMAGVLPVSSEMTERLVKFGYVTATVTEDCLLGRAGLTLRGHSFHYSRMCEAKPQDGRSGDAELSSQIDASSVSAVYRVAYSLSGLEESEGYVQNNVLASYVHLHFGAEPSVADNFVAHLRKARTSRLVHA